MVSSRTQGKHSSSYRRVSLQCLKIEFSFRPTLLGTWLEFSPELSTAVDLEANRSRP